MTVDVSRPDRKSDSSDWSSVCRHFLFNLWPCWELPCFFLSADLFFCSLILIVGRRSDWSDRRRRLSGSDRKLTDRWQEVIKANQLSAHLALNIPPPASEHERLIRNYYLYSKIFSCTERSVSLFSHPNLFSSPYTVEAITRDEGDCSCCDFVPSLCGCVGSIFCFLSLVVWTEVNHRSVSKSRSCDQLSDRKWPFYKDWSEIKGLGSFFLLVVLAGSDVTADAESAEL